MKDPLLLIGKVASCFMNRPLPYVPHQITVNKNVLSVLLNKTFPSSVSESSRSSQCSMTGVTKVVVCVILSGG